MIEFEGKRQEHGVKKYVLSKVDFSCRCVAGIRWSLESVGSVLAVAGTELLHEEVETLLAKLDSLGLQSKTGLQGASNQTVAYSSMYRAGLVPATLPPSMQPGYGPPGVLPGSQLQLTPRRAHKDNTTSVDFPPLSPRDPNRSESP
jgi:hypothetical protein